MKHNILKFALVIVCCVLATACATQPPIINTATLTEQPDNLVTSTQQPDEPPPPTQTTAPTLITRQSSPTLTATAVVTESPPGDLLLEQRLWSLGFVETGLVDGTVDEQTSLAIAHCQWLNNLPITGEISPELLVLLEKEDLVTPSISPPFPGRPLAHYLPAGYAVDYLSARLVDLGYLDDTEPGFYPFQFNTLTQAAVQKFQRSHGLNPSGVVNYQIWNVLFNPAAKSASGELLFPSTDHWDWSTDFYPLSPDPIDLVFDGEFLWVLHSSGESAFSNTVIRIDPIAGLLNQGSPVVLGTTQIPYGEMWPNNQITTMIFDGNRVWFLIPRRAGPPQIISLIPESAEKFIHTTFAADAEFGYPASALGFDGNRIWATDHNQAWAINRNTGSANLSYQVGWLTSGKMAFDGKCMWMAGESGLTTFHTGGNYPCQGSADAYSMPAGQVVFDGQRIWSTGEAWNAVLWLDLKTGVMGDPVTVGNAPSALAFDGSILWVTNQGDNSVQGIDTATGSVGPVIPTGNQPVDIVREGPHLWVINAGDQTLQRINVEDYQIEIIQPTPTPSPAATLTPTITATPVPTQTPTIPPLTRNLQLTTPRMTGDDVLLLQQQLLDLGYDEIGKPDGVFGSITDQGVRHFQTINNLTVDGIVGPITWKLLFSGEALGP